MRWRGIIACIVCFIVSGCSTLDLAKTDLVPDVTNRPLVLVSPLMLITYKPFSFSDQDGLVGLGQIALKEFDNYHDSCLPMSSGEYDKNPEYWQNIFSSKPECTHRVKVIVRPGTSLQITKLWQVTNYASERTYLVWGKIDHPLIAGKVLQFPDRFIDVSENKQVVINRWCLKLAEDR